MFPIIRRSLFSFAFVIFHGSLIALYFALNGRRGALVFFTCASPVWLMAAVLWSEWRESYGFLRLLPIRDRDVAFAKLGLGLAAVLACAVWFALLTLAVWGWSPPFFARLSLIIMAHSAALPLVALCFIGVWRFGIKAMSVPMVVFMVTIFFSLVGTLASRWMPRRGDLGVGLQPASWPVQAAVAALALVLWLLLAGAAPRIKRLHDAHLHKGG